MTPSVTIQRSHSKVLTVTESLKGVSSSCGNATAEGYLTQDQLILILNSIELAMRDLGSIRKDLTDLSKSQSHFTSIPLCGNCK